MILEDEFGRSSLSEDTHHTSCAAALPRAFSPETKTPRKHTGLLATSPRDGHEKISGIVFSFLLLHLPQVGLD